jgi:hypothetical protein
MYVCIHAQSLRMHTHTQKQVRMDRQGPCEVVVTVKASRVGNESQILKRQCPSTGEVRSDMLTRADLWDFFFWQSLYTQETQPTGPPPPPPRPRSRNQIRLTRTQTRTPLRRSQQVRMYYVNRCSVARLSRWSVEDFFFIDHRPPAHTQTSTHTHTHTHAHTHPRTHAHQHCDR